MALSLSLRQKELLTGLLLLGFFGGGFLAGEIGIRLMQMSKFGVERDVESSSNFFLDDATGLRLPRPNKMLGQIRINNLGFRGPDIKPLKGADVFRLGFLGSSTTYDPNSPEGRNWPERVVALLDKATIGCSVDFVNAGQPGYSTQQMLLYYETRIAQLEPDLLVVLPGDMNKDLDAQAIAAGFDATHFEPSWLGRVSVLAAKLEKNFRVVKLQRAGHIRKGKLAVDIPPLVAAFSERLSALVEGVQANGAPMALITLGGQLRQEQSEKRQAEAAGTNLFYLPYITIQDLISVRQAYNEEIRRIASKNGVLVIGGGDEIPGDRMHYSDAMHFTPRGSEAMARRVISRLLSDKEVQDALQARGCEIDALGS